MLVKPKCVWEVADFLKNCKQTAEKCKQIFENWKNLPPLKHILALPTLGQICTITELQPFEISTFQMKHLVRIGSRCWKLVHSIMRCSSAAHCVVVLFSIGYPGQQRWCLNRSIDKKDTAFGSYFETMALKWCLLFCN